MSNYRDDTNETAVASSYTWGGQHSIADETVKANDEVFYRLRMLVVETAVASDTLIESRRTVVTEVAIASDVVVEQLRAADLVTESAQMRDQVRERLLGATINESAAASDQVLDAIGSLTTETAIAADVVLDQRHSNVLVTETARARDSTFQAAKVLVVDNLIIADQVFATVRTRSIITESATASDEVLQSRSASVHWISEQARIADMVMDHLHSLQVVVDDAEISDTVIQGGPGASQAWTANVRTWAMSRYAPFTFSSLVCIEGVVYGANESGVYRLDGDDEVMEAVISTGKMDVGQGVLVHPLNAFLEYELSGTAQLSVSQTQSGMKETYTYALEGEPADELTNGRFKFGRGLRGRHFSFSLRMNGTRSYINDLSVETAPTKRRI